MLRKVMPLALSTFGSDHDNTLRIRGVLAQALYSDEDPSVDELKEAVSLAEDVSRRTTRVFGSSHEIARVSKGTLRNARAALAHRCKAS